jgi:hypothetical protein
VDGHYDEMGVRQRMADAAAALAGVAAARFQKLHIHAGHVQHTDLLVLKHIRAESHSGLLVVDKFFQKWYPAVKSITTEEVMEIQVKSHVAGLPGIANNTCLEKHQNL